jgi:hypothetical protein
VSEHGLRWQAACFTKVAEDPNKLRCSDELIFSGMLTRGQWSKLKLHSREMVLTCNLAHF